MKIIAICAFAVLAMMLLATGIGWVLEAIFGILKLAFLAYKTWRLNRRPNEDQTSLEG